MTADVATERKSTKTTAQRKAQAKRQVVRECAQALREQATQRFGTHGVNDARGAAFWDAACFLDPEDGDALKTKTIDRRRRYKPGGTTGADA